jgi:alpha-ribazole phosphatase
MSRLLLVRHGRSKLSGEKRFWGKTDIELSNEGIQQAERLRERLAEEKISVVYSSTLRRAFATAEIIAARHKLDVQALAELNELNFGFIEGLTFAEIGKLHPELARQLNTWSPHLAFPGGESLDELNGRLQFFFKRLAKHQPKDTVLIVAHGGTLRLLICNLLGLDIEGWWKIQVDHASLSIIDTYPQGAILSLLNDTSHLEL